MNGPFFSLAADAPLRNGTLDGGGGESVTHLDAQT